jgi:hypothetical protein
VQRRHAAELWAGPQCCCSVRPAVQPATGVCVPSSSRAVQVMLTVLSCIRNTSNGCCLYTTQLVGLLSKPSCLSCDACPTVDSGRCFSGCGSVTPPVHALPNGHTCCSSSTTRPVQSEVYLARPWWTVPLLFGEYVHSIYPPPPKKTAHKVLPGMTRDLQDLSRCACCLVPFPAPFCRPERLPTKAACAALMVHDVSTAVTVVWTHSLDLPHF